MSSVIGSVVSAATAATPAADVVKIVAGMVTLLASPTGQAILNQLFVEKGLTVDALTAAIDSNVIPPDPTDAPPAKE